MYGTMIKDSLEKIKKNLVDKIMTFIIIIFIIMTIIFFLSMIDSVKSIKIELKNFEELLKEYRKILDAISDKFIRYRAELDIIEEMIMEK